MYKIIFIDIMSKYYVYNLISNNYFLDKMNKIYFYRDKF